MVYNIKGKKITFASEVDFCGVLEGAALQNTLTCVCSNTT